MSLPYAPPMEADLEPGAAVDALRRLGVVPAVGATLLGSIPDTAAALNDRVLKEIQAYSRSGNPDVMPELGEHLSALTHAVCALLGGPGSASIDFVQSYARRRAQQRFPLEAVLHTYRCCHRPLLEWVRDAALAAADPAAQVRRVVAAAADFALDFTNAVSTAATAEYVQHTRLLAEAEGDRRTQLLNTLLSGYDESDSRTAQLLKRAGYLEQRQSFCVIVARSVDPREMQNTARAQRMVEALSQALRDVPVRTLIGIRDGLVTAVISGSRRLSGWTAPQSLLADRVHPSLSQVGPAALIGVGNDAPSTSHVRRSHAEALLALDFASVANRVMRHCDVPFRQTLVRHACESGALALPAWHEKLTAADGKARGALRATLKTYADCNMNALKTAKALSVHPNTIYARMQRITDLTGKSALDYHHLTELLLVLECDGQLRPG
ncbi:MAG: helix-turn-helix domain-containing protein [Pseudomonadota bacterium]